MGAPATGTALLVLGAFVLPGFVTLLMRERTYVVPAERPPFERLLQALYYSALTYALLLLVGWTFGLGRTDLSDLYDGSKSLGLLLLAGALVALIVPLLIAYAGLRWRRDTKVRPRILKFLRISDAHSIHSGWNAMFSNEGGAMIRVITKDSRAIGGWYGQGSLSGYTEQSQDIYVAERWELDSSGWFVRKAPGSLGVWVAADNIASVELYEAVGKSPASAAQPSESAAAGASAPASSV